MTKHIYDTLLKQDVDERYIEKRTLERRYKDKKGVWQTTEQVLHYYNWAACWHDLVKEFPDATYTFREFEREGKLYDVRYYPDKTAAVECEVTVQGVTHAMWLPVMDYQNKSIQNPDSRAINDAKMRCLVKCIAMFGLGLDIYMGTYEEPIEQEIEEPAQEEEPKKSPTPDKVLKAQFELSNEEGKTISKYETVASWLAGFDGAIKASRDRQAFYNENLGGIRLVLEFTENNVGAKAKATIVKKISATLDNNGVEHEL